MMTPVMCINVVLHVTAQGQQLCTSEKQNGSIRQEGCKTLLHTRTMFKRHVSWYGCRAMSRRSDSHSQIIFIWAEYHIYTHRQKYSSITATVLKVKVKVTLIYVAPSRETSKALFTYKLPVHPACLYLVSVHQMALPLTGDSVRLIAAYY